MTGPNLDLEKPNAIGGLDRLVTNFAIAAIAVVPTFWTCVVMPWRLTQFLSRDDPDGRKGTFLAPGAFFPLALMVSFLAAAVLATPDTVNNNGAYIGPDLAVSVQSAASDGDIWKIIATVMPLYGVAILFGLLGMILKPWTHKEWTLRVSLRAAFYVTAVLISWIILTTAIIDLVWLSTGKADAIKTISVIVFTLGCVALFWMYFWFFRNEGAVSRTRSGALSLAMVGLIAVFVIVSELLIRQ